MNVIRSLTDRERGRKFTQDYDLALLRLKCFPEDMYNGIAPNADAPVFNAQPPTLACKFSSAPGFEQIIAFGSEDGKIALQDTAIKKNSTEPLEGKTAHTDTIFDIDWMPQELKLITASGDRTARLWDVSTSDIKQLNTFRAHSRTIKSVIFRPQDKAVFATGSRDGAIMIWDTRANYVEYPKPDNCIYNAHNTDAVIRSRHRSRTPTRSTSLQSITGLAFQDDYTLLSCSTGDGLIKVWDLRKNYSTSKKEPLPKHSMNYGGKTNNKGFTSLLICPSGITLYANCIDNTIYAYNISSYTSKPIAEYYGHKNDTFYVKACLSPDGKYLASGSTDESAYIWHTSRPGSPLLKLCGHSDEVSCVAWCKVGETKIVTCSDKACHRIWRIGQEFLDDCDIRGFAEAIPHSLQSTKKISTLETTPTMSKPRRAREYRSEYSSESDVTPVNTPQNGVPASNNGGTKRNYEQMLDHYYSGNHKSILSPIQENHEAPAKRQNIEMRGARRLFSPGDEQDIQENSENELQRSCGSESDEPGPSSGAKLEQLTPFSPTLNLPNFVIDGTAPHLLEMSPQKSKENVDWLTKMRKERYAQRNNKSNEKSTSPQNHNTPGRRISRSKSRESRKVPKSPASPLLQFFRPALKMELPRNNNLCLGSANEPLLCSPEEN